MFSAYVAVTLLAIAANAFAAMLDFVRYKQVLINMARVGVPESWLIMLGILKAAGALGLLLGLIGVPLIGTAAAIGLVLFFVGAIIAHLRARDYSIGPAAAFLALAVAALVLDLAS
jgi:DoxX-like family